MSDIGGIVSTSSAMSQAQLRAEVDVSVLRKAMDIQSSTAAQLLDALPEVEASAASTHRSDATSNLGSLLNVRA
ncbi:RNase P/RNase MRP subunit p30 [Natronospira proteinivora]|uniref:RNase P/RNase MRP subunit p30 n=1 Tax=Natronospira proteinivora TaxID=1807133 RepID=A0ABT1G7K4_9GAMM|nr:YjfB family protein [Natronospira proteinivora]MCP1727286.1 RNase P/RNase MRP subunit p30 [Natronospira proteinivora]